MNSLISLAQKLRHVFNLFADKQGKSSGFIKRSRKLTGSALVKMLVFSWLGKPGATLENLAGAGTNHGIKISSQALDKRFTTTAAEFLKTVLEEAVAQVVQAPAAVPIELLNRFSRVYLIDGSLVNLPSELAEQWRGTGKEGEANYASLKLEARLELRFGRLIGPNCLPGRGHDNRGPLVNQPLDTDSLRVQDLGYWDLKRMAEQARRGEYWLSRFKLGTSLWTPAGEPFDLPRWLIHLSHQGVEPTERWVRLGVRVDLNARLIIQRMPPELANRRRAALNKRYQDKGQQPTNWLCVTGPYW